MFVLEVFFVSVNFIKNEKVFIRKYLAHYYFSFHVRTHFQVFFHSSRYLFLELSSNIVEVSWFFFFRVLNLMLLRKISLIVDFIIFQLDPFLSHFLIFRDCCENNENFRKVSIVFSFVVQSQGGEKMAQVFVRFLLYSTRKRNHDYLNNGSNSCI